MVRIFKLIPNKLNTGLVENRRASKNAKSEEKLI